MRGKPNLLLNDEDLLLIDHEQALPFYSSFMTKREPNFKQIFSNYQFDLHIFQDILRKRRKDKEHSFDEFIENLRVLNLSFLDSLFADFEKYEIACGEKKTIFAYLNWCKSNAQYIQQKLLERIK